MGVDCFANDMCLIDEYDAVSLAGRIRVPREALHGASRLKKLTRAGVG